MYFIRGALDSGMSSSRNFNPGIGRKKKKMQSKNTSIEILSSFSGKNFKKKDPNY